MVSWRSAIATGVIDPLGWKIKGMDIGGRLAEFRAIQRDDVETWKARRSEMLGRLLVHAVTRVPFYMQRVTGLTPESIAADPEGSLARFPILERSDLIDQFDELHCEMGRGTYADSSGGSTSAPVRFLHDKHFKTAALATAQLPYDWAGVSRGDRRVNLWGDRHDLAGKHSPVQRLNSFFRDIDVLDAFGMGEEEMSEYVRLLNERPPVCLEGYTEPLFALAEFIEREGLEVTPPRVVLTTAEMLLPHMREVLGRVYRAPVFDRYGSREVGLVAIECDHHNGLHLMGETTVLEMVDANGRDVEVGEAGEAVVTNLWNYTMPFIRYRMEDNIVRGPDLCDCGRPYPLVERVIGRAGSNFRRADGGVVLPDFWVRLLGVEFETGDVRSYQFVQEEVDRITARIVLRPGHDGPDANMRERVTARICDAMGAPTRVDYVIEDDIAPTSSGKHLYSISKVEGGRSGSE